MATRYGLKLHDESVTTFDFAHLYELAGTAQFILAEDLWAVPKYVYEDGSFDIEGQDYNGKMFSVIRSISGTLPASTVILWNPDKAQEWSYTNFSGDELGMAITQRLGAYPQRRQRAAPGAGALGRALRLHKAPLNK